MKPKALLILIPGFPKDEADSTCVPFPQSVVRNLKRLAPELDVIVIAFQYPFIESVYNWYDTAVHPFNGKNKGKIRRLLLWRKILYRIKKINDQYELTGILSFWMGECALIAKYVARKYNVKHFTWLMGQDARKENKYVDWVKPSANAVIALSDFLKREFFRNYGIDPGHVIAPGLEKRIYHKTERPIDIMGAGSLIRLKQYDIFIKVIEKIAVKHPLIKAIICGDGPERARLRQLIDSKSLNRNIELLGEKDHEEVLMLMSKTKVFMHTSAYEGFGMVCAEALHAGAHVVSFCRPMDIIPEHTYIVQSANEMKDKVIFLLDEPVLNHDSILGVSIEETCRKVLSLYS